jgi:hypothetical protein
MTYDPHQHPGPQAYGNRPGAVPPQYPSAPPVVSGAPYYAPPTQFDLAPASGYQPQPPKKSNAVKVALIVCGSVMLLCLSFGIIGAVSGDDTDTKAAPAATTKPAKAAPAAALPTKADTPAPLSPVEKPAQVAMPDVRGQNAAVAGDYLAKLGFTNVTYGSQDQLDSWVVLPENWTVKKQSAKKGRKLPTDTLIVLTCTKTG